ncbi:hypothetical protein D3C71_1948260 [compost metagenome]
MSVQLVGRTFVVGFLIFGYDRHAGAIEHGISDLAYQHVDACQLEGHAGQLFRNHTDISVYRMEGTRGKK